MKNPRAVPSRIRSSSKYCLGAHSIFDIYLWSEVWTEEALTWSRNYTVCWWQEGRTESDMWSRQGQAPESPVAEFIDPDGRDKVNSGIWLSYRSARRCSLVGRYDNPTPELTLSPGQGSMNSATGMFVWLGGRWSMSFNADKTNIMHVVLPLRPSPLPVSKTKVAAGAVCSFRIRFLIANYCTLKGSYRMGDG